MTDGQDAEPVDLGPHQVTGPALAPVCELGHPLAILDGSHLDPQAETAHCVQARPVLPVTGEVDHHVVRLAPDLDHDPAALAWARGKVLEVTGQWRARAARMAGTDLVENAEKWRLIAVAVENTLVGGKTDDLAAFDERHAR